MDVKVLDISFFNDTEPSGKIKECFEQEDVILIRGLDLDENRFEALTRIFCDDFCRISSRESLRKREGDGLTTHTPRENFFLFSHSEAAYAPYPKTPDIGFLMCKEAPIVPGGETTLVDGVEFLNEMAHELRKRFKNEKIIYEFLWEPDRWKAQFRVSSEEELFALLNTLNTIKFSLNNGLLHMFYTTSALTRMADGSYAFSNAILAHLPSLDHPDYKNKKVYCKESNKVYWESGELLPKEIVNQLVTIQDKLKYKHQWKVNDILIFNNLRYMHGREMTQGVSNRELFSRFGYVL
ncbi:MAG: TauD/TfdA family dioxygenase [Campylobacterales bacterium]|nr:TauD/TfdA family dioxygenase [Campylobacterales bacterium]